VPSGTGGPTNNDYRRQTAPAARDKPCPLYKVADIAHCCEHSLS
jgi:hypothetical protein